MNLIRNSSVVIFNCDNIGASVATTLTRSGIKKLILFDNNRLLIENYKNHPFAVLKDINKYNWDILNDYLKKLNPNVELVLIKEAFNFKKLSELFKQKNKPDYIVDCLNEMNIIQKCELIKFSTDNNIKFISTFEPLLEQYDPTQIRHSTFSLLENSRITNLIVENYKKLYNSEIPDFNIVYSKQQNIDNSKKIYENLFCYGVISDTACSIILCDLSKFQLDDDKDLKKEEIKLAGKYLSEAIEDYKKDEIENQKIDEKCLSNITYDDYKNICITFKAGSSIKQKQQPKMRFYRWRLFKEPSKNNIIIMGKGEINAHLKIHNEEELIKAYGKNVVERIDKKLDSF